MTFYEGIMKGSDVFLKILRREFSENILKDKVYGSI